MIACASNLAPHLRAYASASICKLSTSSVQLAARAFGTRTPTLPGKLGDPSMQLGEDPRLDSRLIGQLRPFELDKDAPLDPTFNTRQQIIDHASMIEPAFQGLFEAWFADVPPVGCELEQRTEVITGTDDNSIELFITRRADSPEGAKLPCLYHTHGGGMTLLSAADKSYVYWRDRLAALGFLVVGVEFRNAAGGLGPHPFPAGLNDCYAGLEWTFGNKEALGISTIVVSGESGGGNLSLATAMMAQREGRLEMVDGVYAQCPYSKPKHLPRAEPLPQS